MKRIIEIACVILFAGVVVGPLLYVTLGNAPPGFVGDVMSGLLATAAALIGGIPIALWLDRRIKAAEAEKQQAFERQSELELLELLAEELRYSADGLTRRRKAPERLEVQPLKTDLWAAISAAGKLNVIRNHRLLNRIAMAYYVLNVVRRIEEMAYQAFRGATVTFGNGQTSAQLLWADARQFDVLLADSINAALAAIQAEATTTSITAANDDG
jgi:hypothetical protein